MVRYSKRSDWKLDAFCKTYYAAAHGREHFVQCHERVIQLLDLWKSAGVRVEVDDDGGFWENRCREALAAQVADAEAIAEVECRRVWN